MKRFSLHNRDCLDVLRGAPSDSVDAIVTDPPYGLSFMGKRWDYDVPSVEIWSECLRVLKPGGHLLSFGGSRTYHRMAVNVEDAGFEIRDQVMWVYGSGFPKSHNVSKAIDKMAGAEREVVGANPNHRPNNVNYRGVYSGGNTGAPTITAPATDAAKQWDGWGSALKPAHEPIVLARKPLGEKTLAANVLKHGTGAINVDGCRVGTDERLQGSTVRNDMRGGGFGSGHKPHYDLEKYQQNAKGRFPANLIHDGSDEVLAGFPESKGAVSNGRKGKNGPVGDFGLGEQRQEPGYKDQGSAARFFYCAKASKSDRDEGNIHPTVKPTDLMAYLCRMVTPPGGVVLDPFLGSGSTGKAAVREGFKFIGIEREPEYFAIAEARISAAADLFS